MNYARRLITCLLAGARLANAQPAAEPPIQSPAVVVHETLLTADAGGSTRVQFDETAPTVGRSFSGLTNRVANLQLNAGGAGSFGDVLSLRGLVNTPYFSDPSVTLYFDDLPLGSTFAYPTALFGFASATVERGPQGTAFGRGGLGGTIVFSSVEPGARPFGELRLSLGNYNNQAMALEVRSARTDQGDATVSAAFNRRDGFVTNTQLGTRVDDQEVLAASARVRVRPNPGTELTFQLLGTTHHDGAQPLVPLSGGPFSVARGREGSTESKFVGGAIKAAFNTSLGRLTSTTSHSQWKLNPYENRLVLPPSLDSRVVQSQRIWNEELRLASAAKEPLAWHVAGWFSDGTTEGNIRRNIVLPFGSFPYEVSNFELKTRTLALFGDVRAGSLGDWDITAGLRAERTSRQFLRGESVPTSAKYTASRVFQAMMPRVTASYPLDANTKISASVAHGIKPGGWSAYTSNATLAGFNPERVTSFELGVDTASADKTFNFAARTFAYLIRDYQIERSFTQTDYLVVNAPRARSFGGEIEASWRPAPAWTLTSTLGITQVSLRKFTDPFSGTVLDGNRAPYTPDFDLHLSATYRTPTGLYAAAEFAMVGTTYYDESQDPAFKTDSRETANARLGYSTRAWRLGAYMENIGNVRYYSMIIPGVGHAAPGAPRTYGIEFVRKW